MMAGELELDDLEISFQQKTFFYCNTAGKNVGINISQDIARLVLS